MPRLKWLGGVAVRTSDLEVDSWPVHRRESTRSTQPSIPPGLVRAPACGMGLGRGALTCVGWQVALCDLNILFIRSMLNITPLSDAVQMRVATFIDHYQHVVPFGELVKYAVQFH